MNWSKPLIIASTDLKMAMNVGMVKYGLIMSAAFGPIITIASILGLAFAIPASEVPFVSAMLSPFISSFLALFAIVPATLISANSLVGEREQNTLEPLLCTPLTDMELLWGKILASAVPSLVILAGSTIITLAVPNILLLIAGKSLLFIPDLPGLFLIGTSGVVMIFAVIAVMIIVSGRVSRVYEAYQVSSALILVFMLPMMLPMATLTEGIPQPAFVWLVNIITLLVAVAILLVGWLLALGRFNRDKMISQ